MAACERKLAICLVQLDDLSTALTELLDDLFAGRKRHRTYRQLKMYNDPTLNPYLYRAKKKGRPDRRQPWRVRREHACIGVNGLA